MGKRSAELRFWDTAFPLEPRRCSALRWNASLRPGVNQTKTRRIGVRRSIPSAGLEAGAPVKGGTGGCKYACLDNRARGRVKHLPPNRRKAISPVPKRFASPFPACPADSRICGGCGGRGRGFAPGRLRAASSQSSRSCGRGKPVRARCFSTSARRELSRRCRWFPSAS